jgi:uncharacterized membrane protein YhaH (DUF805 family)
MKTTKSATASFFRDFLRNIIIILLTVLVLFILFPSMMRQVLQIYGGLFALGVLLVFFIIAALPRKIN